MKINRNDLAIVLGGILAMESVIADYIVNDLGIDWEGVSLVIQVCIGFVLGTIFAKLTIEIPKEQAIQ